MLRGAAFSGSHLLRNSGKGATIRCLLSAAFTTVAFAISRCVGILGVVRVTVIARGDVASPSTFGYRILAVIECCAEEKVGRIHAGRIIAAV